MAGVAGLPETSNINGCDTKTAQAEPAETAANPRDCRTFGLSDDEVRALAKAAKWDTFVISDNGNARRIGLIFDRETHEDLQLMVIGATESADDVGHEIEERWRRLKRDNEENIRYLRSVELGVPDGQHIMVRLPVAFEGGELFRCAKCKRSVPGRFDPHGPNWRSSYSLITPKISSGYYREVDRWREFHRPCKGEA